MQVTDGPVLNSMLLAELEPLGSPAAPPGEKTTARGKAHPSPQVLKGEIKSLCCPQGIGKGWTVGLPHPKALSPSLLHPATEAP